MENTTSEHNTPWSNEASDNTTSSENAMPNGFDDMAHQGDNHTSVYEDGSSLGDDEVTKTKPTETMDEGHVVNMSLDGPGPDEGAEQDVIAEKTIDLAKQLPIEVVLYPPSDPDAYQHIPKSKRMLRILEEVESGDELYYEVEFTDGRIREASYEDVIHCKGGKPAYQAYQQSKLVARGSSKRPHSEDEYEESGSDYGGYGYKKRRKTRRAQSFRQTRRSTRQASRQASIETSHLEHGSHISQSRTMSLEGSEDEADRSTPKHSFSAAPRTLRLTRSRNSNSVGRRSSAVLDSDDELAQETPRFKDVEDDDDGEYDLPIIRSDILSQPRTSRRKKRLIRPRGATLTRTYNSDSSIEFETTRRSGRSGRNLRSLKDPEIDEFETVEDKPTNAPKHAAVKETFKEVTADSPFRRVHSDTCEVCKNEGGGAKNTLVYCQGCSLSYHKGCIGIRAAREHRVTKVGPDNFVLQCKYCIQVYKGKDARAPAHAKCQVCKTPGLSCSEFSSRKTPKQEEKARLDNGGEDPITPVRPQLINNADNVLFRCANCKCGYHFDHLPSMTSETIADEGVRENRLEEYSLTGWNCKECTNAKHKIHTLVAWRPVVPGSYRPGQTLADYGEDDIEYLVKWAGRSHFHDTWMPGAWVFGTAPPVMRLSFHKRESSTYPKMDMAAAIPEEWLLADVLLNVKYRTRSKDSTKADDLKRIDEITSVFVKFQGLSYEEVVWDEPPARDSGAIWDAFSAAYDEYLNGKYFVTVPDYKMRERISLYRSLDFGRDCELKSQPPQLKQGKLMEYQMEGVNFLLYNFHQQQNVILADEMGLGKTVQIVAFISALTHSKPGCWPFLVVVPNATCPNWRRELKQWAPDLRVVTYHGGRAAQELAYRHELYPEGPKGGMKAHVVIMSFEAAANSMSTFSQVRWVGLIVDEGQRLKNDESNLYKSLREMKIPCRILLTGTPLQNNKRELFNLLQFIDSRRKAEELDAKYAELTKENLPELHSLIRPYFLRRTKAQVLKFLPPMAQIILPVTMTVLQEKLSKSIMARNPDLIKAIISKSRLKASERKSMTNILSDLRQCLCHPFCFNTEIEDKTVDAAQMHRNLVEASPKLLLLDLMLPKLKERGHRVLIFSQYLHSLTILEDFLAGMNLQYARIDGTLSALEKQKRIDAFNMPDSPLFAMLLSTRAGGVGINLATADTVIIYDPDFNPHQDIQALSRAHRIGQKNKVLCFQLMTKDTVEEKIMQIGRKKMALDHALIESMDAKEEAGEDLESILKHGAAALFSDESKDKIVYDHASVDKLLDRSQIENTDTGDDDSAETQFSFARIWANDKGDLDANTGEAAATDDIPPETSTSIWENILKEREAEHQRELAAKKQEYGRGARRRGTQIDYKTNRPRGTDDNSGSDVDSDDELYTDQNDVDNDEDEDSEGEYLANGEKALTPKVSSDVPAKATPRNPAAIKAAPSWAPRPPGRPRNPAKTNTPKPVPQPVLNGQVRSIQNGAQHYAATTNAAIAQHLGGRQPLAPPHQAFQNNVTGMNNMRSWGSIPESLSTVPVPPVQGGQIILNMARPSGATPVAPPRQRPAAPPAPPAPPAPLASQQLQFPAVRLPNGEVTHSGRIGGGNPCAICRRHHLTSNPCVDLNSVVSLRMALDRLRSFGVNDATCIACRTFFTARLQAVTGNVTLRLGAGS